ncbi:class I SAM-dependent methyltransferase [Nocardia stercoris]|uniref:Class I SAM-dependent methyltransferase n=1 Tax=Nocardia stercoris TaxID=2483361 RepID=A0A3M2KTN7_9NOCA|nr:class I SAM-dependent methyltransferase [Nocardia stercoris]RMI28471.1 class I SAM-dependent methyltransferase [Nocardia stercoris]
MTEADEVELRARRANSFGPTAETYSAHRPDYPLDGIRWALQPMNGTPVVLDLGAGTGKLTGGLLACGATVTAVEPDPAMRAEFTRHYPQVSVLDGSAEAVPLPDSSVDAVVAGQAMHWFDLDHAFPEIARVLRPGGVLAGLWNDDDREVGWVRELADVAASSVSKKAGPNVEALPVHPMFHPFETAEFTHSMRTTAAGLTATIGTHSHTLVISPQERAQILDGITAFLLSRPETGAGEFLLPLRTTVIRAVMR